MKKIFFITTCGLLLFAASIYSFTTPKAAKIDNSTIKWYSIEEAMQAQETNPKKMFIDVYTDWCGWCKVMDKKTFTDPAVIEYLNENFYAVKFNAEQRKAITFQGKEYAFVNGGRRGIHTLAYELLDRQASYPSFVVLDENLSRLGILKGYQTPEVFVDGLQGFLPQ